MKPLLYALLPLIFLPAAAVFPQPSSNSDQAVLVQGNNAFALDLYGQLRQRDGNLFFSPASINTAFAMAYAGAQGSTASEMAATLHYTLPPERLHPAMGALLADLNAAHNGYQLHVADALWAAQDETFLPGYLNLTKADYGAGFHAVDFKTAPEAVRLTINQWVEQQTANKITNLLRPGALTPDTRLVLTNAIYFKGDWQTPFYKAWTKDEDFYLTAKQTVKAPLMFLRDNFFYLNGGSFQILNLPYESGDLSMIVLLPNDADGLPALEQSLTAAKLQQWMTQLLYMHKIMVYLPRFKMTEQFELSGALAALGMKQAFQPGVADFSAMTGKRDLWISKAIHKAYINVDEVGTEAAAATGLLMVATAVRGETPPIEFRADHPFLFLIRDNRSGGILFMGRVNDPTK